MLGTKRVRKCRTGLEILSVPGLVSMQMAVAERVSLGGIAALQQLHAVGTYTLVGCMLKGDAGDANGHLRPHFDFLMSVCLSTTIACIDSQRL